MKRHIDQSLFNQFKTDFQSLITKVKNSNGELDLRLRDNYVNLYYQGNSLAKIEIRKGYYMVSIHRLFADTVFIKDTRNPVPTCHSSYNCYKVLPFQVKVFFQAKNLQKLYSNIKKVNNGEEITFEQMLITDNLANNDIIIIDRQITETSLKGRRLDLLALKSLGSNDYQFLVLEVKLGNNKDLNLAVGNQLNFYIQHITSNFNDWKSAYETVYCQLEQLSIYPNFQHKSIKILPPVEGRVIVGSYSGIAKRAINNLKQNFSTLSVKQITLPLV